MSSRSPYNDRYKTDQKGTTRRSASSAKPKRAIADLTPSTTTAKKPEKKKGLFGGGKSAPRPTVPALTPTPRMKQLRLTWWILWVVALVVAVGILLIQRAGGAVASLIPIGWGVWLVAMGGAFYLEFLPIRKERAAMIEAAAAAKHSKPEKPAKGGKSGRTGGGSFVPPASSDVPAPSEPPAPDDRQPPEDQA
jgi:hypothetical protein